MNEKSGIAHAPNAYIVKYLVGNEDVCLFIPRFVYVFLVCQVIFRALDLTLYSMRGRVTNRCPLVGE